MRVFVTRRLPEQALEIVRAVADVDLWDDDNPPPRSAMEERIANAAGVLCLLTDRIDGTLLDGAPKLKVVSQMAVGFDNIDVPACTARGIKVGNTPGVLTETTADLAYALLLATARRVVEAEHDLRDGNWQTWRPMQWTGPDVHHSTLGIVGMGRIGFEMARRAHGFEQTILYTGRSRNPEAEEKFDAQFVDMDALLERSDFVSLHTPLNSETRHLFGKTQFEKMKRTAILINTARGAVVNQSELVDALKNCLIAGAGLDVFEIEPLPLKDPLLSLPNVVLIPHIGSASIATRTKMAVLAARNVVAGIKGEKLVHGLN
jgi:glyoxylate reductase